jgi:hypothetical protein
MNDFLKLLADFGIALTREASEKPGKRRGMGLEGPEPTKPLGPQGLLQTRRFPQGFARLAEKKAPNSEELGV